MSELYVGLLPLSSSKVSILDADYSSGKGVTAISEKGFDFTAIDATNKLLRLANDK